MSDYSKQLDAENERKIIEIGRSMPPFAKLYFDDAKRSKLSRTRLEYARNLRGFFVWMKTLPRFENVDLNTVSASVMDSLTFEDFEDYKASIEFSARKDSNGNNLLSENTTVARKLSALRSFMKFYYMIGAIKNNLSLFISMPKIAEKNIIALDPSEVDSLIDTISSGYGLTEKQKKQQYKTIKRDTAIVLTLLGTGIRVSELVGLDLGSVDFNNGRLLITLKGGNDGYSYFGSQVEFVLYDYINSGRDLLSPLPDEKALFLSTQHRRITVRSLELIVKKYTSLSGISGADKITPHKLRATYGTHLYEQSGDIKLVATSLHHKSVETTSKHYVKDSDEHHRMVVDYTEEMFNQK